MDDKQRDELVEMCVNIFAHADVDCEITLFGNGVNPAEASLVAFAILDVLKVKRTSIKHRIRMRVRELEGLY